MEDWTADVIGIKEMAQRLHRSERSIHRYIALGIIPRVKIGGLRSYVVSRAGFEGWIKDELIGGRLWPPRLKLERHEKEKQENHKRWLKNHPGARQ